MPYGVVALLANTLATRGLKAVMDMGLFILLLYLGLAIMFAAEALLLTVFGVNPLTYFKKAKSPLVLAFTSRSSMGVLPLTVETLTHRLGSFNNDGQYGEQVLGQRQECRAVQGSSPAWLWSTLPMYPVFLLT